MWGRVLGAVAGLLVMLALVGCGAGAGGTASGESSSGTSSGGSAESTETLAAPYPAIAPESANENNAVANLDKALAAQIESSKLTAEQSGGSGDYFTNEEGYEPQFIGHQVTLFTEQKDNGRWGQYSVIVLGDKVTVDSVWDRAAAVTRDNGILGEQFWTLDFDFDFYATAAKYSPESPAEKAAVERAAAWGEANLPDAGPLKAELTGYVFAFGNPDDVPNMLLTMTPDGMPTGSVTSSQQ